MTLTLRAISLNDHPLTQPITARFDTDGGSIGRADHNTLALPDPERHISRQHAEIRASADGYLIRNVGSANPIIIRGKPLGRGESARLQHREQVRIGGYLLEVIEEDAGATHGTARGVGVAPERAGGSAPAPVAVRRPPSALPKPASFGPRTSPGSASAGLADLNAPLSACNPFADLLQDSAVSSRSLPAFTSLPERASRPGPDADCLPAPPFAAAHAVAPNSPAPTHPSQPSAQPLIDPFADLLPPAAGISASSAAWAPAAPSPVRAVLPDDFDPFAMPAPPAPPDPRQLTADAGTFDDLIPSAAPASIDHLFGLEAGGRDPLADFMADLPRGGADEAATTPGLSRWSTDPMALFDSPSAIPPPPDAAPSRADDEPELRAAFVPPRLLAPSKPAERRPVPLQPAATTVPPQAAPPSPSPSPGRHQAEPQALWAAFCAGAGITLEQPHGVTAGQMHLVGSLLRAAVAGTLQLMMVRATTKHELGAEVTMIRARHNNPLKFSPDAASALEQLLRPPLRGFLPGPEAMTDAMHDLVGHTIGTMAGTRAALEGVLDRFGPQPLEAKLSAKTVLDSLVPMSRKAKLWELYLQHFETIRNEAHDDFHALFGRAFLQAYEQQLDRLRQDEKSGPA